MLGKVAVDFGRNGGDGFVDQDFNVAIGLLGECGVLGKDEGCGGGGCSGFQEVAAFHLIAPL